MKYQFVYIMLAVLLMACSAWSSDCEIKGHKLNAGETYEPIGECVQYTCSGKNAFSAKTCPSFATLKPCKFTATDLTKPYPTCCPQQDC